MKVPPLIRPRQTYPRPFTDQDKLIKGGRGKNELATADLRGYLLGVFCLAQIHQGQFSHAPLSKAGKKEGGHQGAESFIRTDIGSGPFSPNVLLSCRKREDETA